MRSTPSHSYNKTYSTVQYLSEFVYCDTPHTQTNSSLFSFIHSYTFKLVSLIHSWFRPYRSALWFRPYRSALYFLLVVTIIPICTLLSSGGYDHTDLHVVSTIPICTLLSSRGYDHAGLHFTYNIDILDTSIPPHSCRLVILDISCFILFLHLT